MVSLKVVPGLRSEGLIKSAKCLFWIRSGSSKCKTYAPTLCFYMIGKAVNSSK